ncbi:MAG TPA: acetolactate synthase small subunit [Clostridia bacterium]|nr:acetolactate synthase small subunit [Clostridia bacterium]
MTDNYVISALVANHPGVLQRIAGLFSRRGYNIDSLSVCATQDPALSRMTIVVNGDLYILNQMLKQLDKLEDVIRVVHLERNTSIYRELLMLKLRAFPEDRATIIQAAQVYNATVSDLASESLIVELTATPSDINAFLNLMRQYPILELVRTGLTALARGNKTIHDDIKLEEE